MVGDYTGYIAVTYGVSAAALLLLAMRSLLALRRTEEEVVALRQARRQKGSE